MDTVRTVVKKYLDLFLAQNPDFSGWFQVYDRNVNERFAVDPHIDLYIWMPFDADRHRHRDSYVSSGIARIARLFPSEVAAINQLALEIKRQGILVELSRIEAGRCTYVIRANSNYDREF